MQNHLIISILAEDKLGLVESLSKVLNAHHSSWNDSRMSRLAGKFAGILSLDVADENLDALMTALKGLENDHFKLLIEKTNADEAQNSQMLNVSVLGQDRRGIVHDITSELAKLSVNIESLESQVRPASMSTENLFEANLQLSLPADVSTDTVIDTLEGMSDQLMVDINFND